MITFGFEAEFETNASQMLAKLVERDLTTQDGMHSWHCSCEEHCHFDLNPDTFRGQTDSTCSGEIISPVYAYGDQNPLDRPRLPMEDFLSHVQVLQEAAIEVDAEPGTSSGFHVHIRPESNRARKRIPWEFARWEQVLIELAGGSQGRHRSMNERIASYQQSWWAMYGMHIVNEHGLSGTIVDIPTLQAHLLAQETRTTAFEHEVLNAFYSHVQESDRHANLAISARHQTLEFRVWNSTRAAWRMALFCGVSRVFGSEDFLEALALVPVTDGMDGFCSTVEAHDPDLAEAIGRQRRYLERTEFPEFYAEVPALANA